MDFDDIKRRLATAKEEASLVWGDRYDALASTKREYNFILNGLRAGDLDAAIAAFQKATDAYWDIDNEVEMLNRTEEYANRLEKFFGTDEGYALGALTKNDPIDDAAF